MLYYIIQSLFLFIAHALMKHTQETEKSFNVIVYFISLIKCHSIYFILYIFVFYSIYSEL